MATTSRLAALASLLLLSACNAASPPTAALYGGPGGAPYGRFRCDGGGMMDVRRAGGSDVAVTSPAGEEIVLPASPPGQRSRYGADGYALVIEGTDALFMKAGDMPLDCRR